MPLWAAFLNLGTSQLTKHRCELVLQVAKANSLTVTLLDREQLAGCVRMLLPSAVTHGIAPQYMQDEEHLISDSIEVIGTVIAHLSLLRLQHPF